MKNFSFEKSTDHFVPLAEAQNFHRPSSVYVICFCDVLYLREMRLNLPIAIRSPLRLHEVLMIKSEHRFYSLFSAMSEGVALHEVVFDNAGQAIDYKILDVNPAFEHQTGISRKQVVGKLASAAYGTGDAPFLETYEKVATTGAPTKFEQYFAPLDKHFIISVFAPEKNQFATVFSDISTIKLAEKKLAISEAGYRALFEGTGDYVLVLRPENDGPPKIIDVNCSACEKFGYSRDELLGKPITFLDKRQTREDILERINLLQTQGKASFEVEHICKDGSAFWAQVSVRIVTIGGEKLFYAVEHDVSERKRAELALAESLVKLKERELSKTRFFAAAGHDLRQPLAAANLFLDALKLTEPTLKQDKLIQNLDCAMSTFRLGFNRWMQQIGQIALPVFRSLVFFLDVHSIFSLQR